MPLPVILIFDIGKTNKKVLLFNRQYDLIFEQSEQLPETADEDGFPCEDIHLLTTWIQDSFKKIQADERFEIVAVNCSAYGASFVHLDERLQPFLPLYNYLKPYPEKLTQQFYSTYDKAGTIAVDTASPALGHLNSGLQLYWLKHTRPEAYHKIKYSLHLPQYLSFLLCGAVYSDITSIGCHTMLWNFQQQAYHSWVQAENITAKLPPVLACTSMAGRKNKIAFGAGLHDSSAALIPYLAAFGEPFILLSTGTWCISLNPFNTFSLTGDELANDCLCYLTYDGRPVKASRLFAGYEHGQQVKRICDHFNQSELKYTTMKYDAAIINRLMLKSDGAYKLSAPQHIIKTSLFAGHDLNSFSDGEEAYHQLVLDLIVQQYASTQLVLADTGVKKIFVDGGFSKNTVYMNLLAAFFQGVEVYAATVAQATAVGAAIAIKAHWNDLALPAGLITVKRYQPAQI